MYRANQPETIILVVALGGKIIGIDPETGQEVWRNKLPGGGYQVVEIHVAQTRVLALVGGKLFELDRATGTTRWEVEVAGSGRGTMLIEGKRIFVMCSGELTAVSESGKKLWSTSLPDMGVGSAALGLPGNVRQGDSTGGS